MQLFEQVGDLLRIATSPIICFIKMLGATLAIERAKVGLHLIILTLYNCVSCIPVKEETAVLCTVSQAVITASWQLEIINCKLQLC